MQGYESSQHGLFNGETGRGAIRNVLHSVRKKYLDKQFFSLCSKFHDKSGQSDKNRESGRQPIKSVGLECLSPEGRDGVI